MLALKGGDRVKFQESVLDWRRVMHLGFRSSPGLR